jgi:acetyl-CoA acetyltransferase
VRLVSKAACIVGVGTTEFTLGGDKSPMRLQAEAFFDALDDARLGKSDIDGIVTAYGSPQGVDYEEFVAAVGLDVRYADQAWAHGRWATGTVLHAGLAVMAGLASYVAIANTNVSGKGYLRHLTGLGGEEVREGLRDTGGGHGEWTMHGTDTPGAATALVAQRYMDKYGAGPEDLARICAGQRGNAALNPAAALRGKPLTVDSYFAEPAIAGPFRRCDYALSSSGSSCLIVTTVERARDLGRPFAVIAAGQTLHSSRDSYVLFARPGLGAGFGGEYPLAAEDHPVYADAGITRADIDALYIYDSFSSNLWMTLERFGFCGEGEAADWIAQHGIGAGAPLPLNTNGGLLSEGHNSGYAHIAEMVRQVRGEAGPRQADGATWAQWATPWGDSLILGPDRT